MHSPAVYIEGFWFNGEGAPLTSYNPATGTVVWHGNAGSHTQKELARASGQRTFSFWSELPRKHRWELLLRSRSILESKKKELISLISEESGKPIWEADMDLKCALNCFTNSATIPAVGLMEIPIPYDAPFQKTHEQLIPALLAGNTVLLTSSRQIPAIGESLLRCWNEGGLPHGVLNLTQGGEMETIEGITPMIIWENHDISKAVKLTLLSSFFCCGQSDRSTKLLLVQANESYLPFLEALILAAKQLTIGPSNTNSLIGPMLSPVHAKQSYLHYEKLLREGASSLLPMSRHQAGPAFLSPAILEWPQQKKTAFKPITGPLLQILPIKSLQEALSFLKTIPPVQEASLITQNSSLYQELMQELFPTTLFWNRSVAITGASV